MANNSFSHAGIRGMKWGHRKAEPSSGASRSGRGKVISSTKRSQTIKKEDKVRDKFVYDYLDAKTGKRERMMSLFNSTKKKYEGMKYDDYKKKYPNEYRKDKVKAATAVGIGLAYVGALVGLSLMY